VRWALGIEYDGSAFLGWQRQLHGPSVQDTVQRALGKVADHELAVVCAGRTDTGVHARCQVVHFDTDSRRDPRAFVLGANSLLPGSVVVRWAHVVDGAFHARYSASARRYRYTVLNRPVRPALEASTLSWERLPLDVDAMARAAQALIGEHDFTSFRTVACQSKSPVRRLEAVRIRREQERVHFEFRANAFLHHMVRNLVGSLLQVGLGERPEAWIADVLARRDRTVAGPTATPEGLVFIGPQYPASFLLPPEVTLGADDA
jgi:tRNA pseudouridine38-40 synthase